MKDEIHMFEIQELLDPRSSLNQAAAGRDVEGALQDALRQQLRCFAGMDPGTVSASIRHVYQPSDGVAHPQARLRIFLCARAQKRVAKAVSTLVRRGPLARLLRLKAVSDDVVPWDQMAASCHVSRRDALVKPAVRPEYNDRLPENYYVCGPLEPNDSNNGMLLDTLLGGIEEPVVFDICVESTQVDDLRTEYSRYLSRLHEVSQLWGRDDRRTREVDLLGESDGTLFHQEQIPVERRPDTLASSLARTAQRFRDDTLTQPHLQYHIAVLASDTAIANLLGSAIAECAFDNGSYQLFTHASAPAVDSIKEALRRCETIDPHVHPGLCRNTASGPYRKLDRLIHCATVDELSSAFSVPVPSHRSPLCMRMDTDPPIVPPDDLITVGYDIMGPQGCVPDCALRVARGIPRDVLAKHVCVFGVPGAGKTTHNLNLCMSLSRDEDVRFLVIECRKTEYRSLKRLAGLSDPVLSSLGSRLEVYTPGAEHISPFRLNPLEVWPGTPVSLHQDLVLNCFYAAMPLGGPLPGLLGEALEEVHHEFADAGRPPILADLVRELERVLRRKGYAASTSSDIAAAADVRIKSLTRGSVGTVFQCATNTPDLERLLHTNAIIELDHLGRDQACLFVLTLLTGIRQVVKALPSPHGRLRYVIIIEEAHTVVGASTDPRPSEENADPRAYAADYISQMLAELRALGVGIVISDQLPSAVAPQVIKNAGTAVVFREVADEDRELIGGTMLLSPTEREELARLRPGEAFFFTEGYFRPRKIRTPNAHQSLDLRPLRDDELKAMIASEPWYRDVSRRRAETELAQLHDHLDTYDAERIAVAGQTARLAARLAHCATMRDAGGRSNALRDAMSRADVLRERLEELHRQMMRGPRRRLVPDGSDRRILAGTGLDDVLRTLKRRADDVCDRDTQECLQLLGRLKARAREMARQIGELP